MGRRKIYATEDLLEIVLEYEKQTRQKIQFTELRDFAKDYDIKFEEIEDRHFSRNPIIAEKVKELNKRKLSNYSIKKNVILYSSSPDTFFELSTMEQRSTIVETRDMVYKMEMKIRKLENENIELSKENTEARNLREAVDVIQRELYEFEKKFRVFKKYITKTVDDMTEERLLAESPEYRNNKIKLAEGENFLMGKKEELFSLEREIKKLRSLCKEVDNNDYSDDDKDKKHKIINDEISDKIQVNEDQLDFGNIFTIE